ncbi:MAG TPA: hypothetical protein ENI34_06550 [candidate division WOR-3 bacterium]|uniref:Radical SAM protein n=1 Tax=candidate division WOR-3 bacterium TaxID=2052148 RepID=A0A9C9ENV8_UNCW3|nr:hypothetical protein [candidate division WOR-3 bacterium]
MKVLFYNPAPIQKRYVPFEAIKGSAFFRRPNYDAMRLAFLIKNDEFVYYDERIEEKPQFKPDIVVVNVPLNLSRYIATTIRKKWHRTKIICYGFYSTLFPEENKKFADVVVVGDIVNIWDRILSDAKNGRLEKLYLSKAPPRFNLNREIEKKYGFTPLLSQMRISFGCTCSGDHKDFCYENIMYKKFTLWKLSEAVREISRIKRKIIFMRDDDFLYDLDYALKFLERCWRYKRMWIFQTGGALFKQPRIFSFLRDNGVRIIHLKEDWLGDDLVNKIKDKDYRKEKMRQVGMLHKKKIACGCKLRLGFPGEDFSFYQRLFAFLKKIKIDFIKLTVQTPLPGTDTYRKYRRKGLIAKDLTLYDQWMPVVHIPGITPQALYSWMEWLRDSFYSWDSILIRNILVSPRLGFYNTVFFYLIPNLSYRNNFLEKVGYPP